MPRILPVVLTVLALTLMACGGGGGGGGDDETIVVTNLADAGEGSLRAALASVSPGGTVLFDEDLAGTITLTSGSLVVGVDVRIQGPGASVLAISGDDTWRVFELELDLEVSIQDLTIRDGLGGGPLGKGGAGIRAPGATLLLRGLVFMDCFAPSFGRGGGLHILGGIATVEDCTFQGCHAEGYGGGFVCDSGVTTMRRCTVYDCSAVAAGGGLASSGAELHCLNCTFSGNTTTGANRSAGGLGVYSSSTSPPTSASLSFCTFTLNSATATGGGIATGDTIDDEGNPVPVLLRIKNTVVADNTAAGAGQDMDNGGSLISGGNNVIGIGEDSGLFDGLNGDQVGSLAAPLEVGLLALADNGGDTPTHLPLALSPAVDVVPVAESTNRLNQFVDNDQRGVLRPVGAACDAGAVERD